MILHLVLYQPKSTATPDELRTLAEAIAAASKEIPGIRQVRVGKANDFRFGYKVWPDNRLNGYVALFEFGDKNDLVTYLNHQAHRKLAELFWKTSDNPMILDVTAVDPTVESLFGLMAK